jgi:three-Cys-motif partner protein
MAKPSPTEWPSEPRTLLKHQIYRRYIHCWMGKILQVFPSATIVDGFAGPGRYSDGPSGSSLVIARAFLENTGVDRFHPLRLVSNEGRADRRDALANRISELPAHPSFQPTVLPASDFADAQQTIDSIAHPGGNPLPTLWILDPFNVKALPFDLVATCLARPRDEVLITWFADEIFRFCEVPAMQGALDRHYGNDSWRSALSVAGEHQRKESLMSSYRASLESLPKVRTGALSISSKNASARYSMILATHSDKGLECWNPVKWGLDPAAGQTISEKQGIQDALFDDRVKLRDALRNRAGSAATFGDLRTEATRLGFMESQVRTTLDELAEAGLAVREQPLDTSAKSPWPSDSLIRFYEEAEQTTPDPDGPEADQAGR